MVRPIGVQLYSLRDYAKDNFMNVLKKVAEIGYTYVEPAGSLWGLTPADFLKVLEDLGLKMISSHLPWARVNNLSESIDLAQELKLDKIVCGYGPDDFKDMDAIKRTAESTCKIYEAVSAAGLTLFQHNHAFEFERLDGRLKYEIYNDLVPAGLKYQLDCFWSTNFGTEDPVRNVNMFGDRTILLHMKDGVCKQQANEQKMVNGILDRKIELLPLGTGTLPIADIINAAPASAEAVIVELDYCSVEMFQAIEESYRFLTANGLAKGTR